MDLFIQQLVAGIATGGIYGIVALALVMIYQSTNHLNFAQGEMAMFSTFVAWSLVQAGVALWVAFLLTVAASFMAGVAIERMIIRRFNNAPVLAVVIVFVGLLVSLNSVAGWIWSYMTKTFPSVFPTGLLPRNPYVSAHELGMIAVILILLTVLYVFFRFTSLGLAMRAAAQNPVSARLVGIRVDHMLGLGWGLAAAIGAVAGMLVAPIVFLDPNMMSGVLIYAFAAALLGGIGSPLGAVIGGFIVGVVENLLGTYVIGTELKLTGAFLLIIAILLVRPAGLFGRVYVSRV